MKKRMRQSGFTIVELLIVIVVIGILAAITIVAYNGIQTRAQTTKINSDLTMLDKAIKAARVNENKALFNITLSGYTANLCNTAANGTDLTDRGIAAINTCWTTYATTLDRISTASGMNVRGLVDPWGRPYRIDENENETAGSCAKDNLSTFLRPHVAGGFENVRLVDNSIPGC